MRANVFTAWQGICLEWDVTEHERSYEIVLLNRPASMSGREYSAAVRAVADDMEAFA